jgi:hypothetical protein
LDAQALESLAAGDLGGRWRVLRVHGGAVDFHVGYGECFVTGILQKRHVNVPLFADAAL